MELFDRIGHPYWTAVASRNLANDYERLGDFERAVDHFRKATEISERMEYPFPLLSCLAHIGAIYEAMGDREQARGRYVEGIEKALDVGVQNLTISLCLVSCLRGLDRIYRDLGQENAFEDLCRRFREERLHDIEQVGLTQCLPGVRQGGGSGRSGIGMPGRSRQMRWVRRDAGGWIPARGSAIG